jgi:hypothetical protein
MAATRNFGSIKIGGIVEPVAELTDDALRNLLPLAKRDLPTSSSFIEGVQAIAATWADIAADSPEKTPDTIKRELKRIEGVAHRMSNALAPLADGSELFENLETGAMYLFMRNNETSSDTAGRPVVPSLSTNTTNLAALLQRISGDLEALRTACTHTAQKIKPKRSTEKSTERNVVELVVKAYEGAFGELPPLSDWFTDDLVAFVGQRMGLSIGKTVVTEVVNARRSSKSPERQA